MTLIKCEDCGREISPRALSCPGCGASVAKQGAPQVPSNTPPPKSLPPALDDILKYVNRKSRPSTARSVNGIGATFGGYVCIPGFSDLGFVKHYVCLLFIPVFPLGTYLVQNWDGNGGSFIGEISAEDARRFVSGSKQGIAVVINVVVMLATFIAALYLIGLLMHVLRS